MYQELQQVRKDMTADDSMFAMHEVERRGVKLREYKLAPPSLRVLWDLSQQYAERDYLVYGDERWTYAQAYAEAASLANWCQAKGIKQGERVAIAMRNYPEWVMAYWALTGIGIAVVGMNAWWVADEMAYALKDSQPRALICDRERLAVFEEIRDQFPDIMPVGVRLEDCPSHVTPWSEVKAQGGSMPEVAIDGDEDACIFYTSGTTGRPKGAQLTQSGCVHNVMNIAFMNLMAVTALARAGGDKDAKPDPGSMPVNTVLLTTPLFHVTANNCVLQPATLTGGKVVCMYKWDAGEALKLIEREKITAVSGVPVMARELIAHPDFAKRDTSSLIALGGGGAALQPDLVAKIDTTVKTARPLTGYGLTETCGIVSAANMDYFVDRPESVGTAPPVLDVKCIDEAGATLPQGKLGEICVKGPVVIKGYLNRAEATAEAIQDGWFRTGDIGRVDEEGFIYIVDRAKDMVLRGGENIYCAEVENAIFKHDAVAECAAFAVPDERLGEEVGIAIHLAAGATITADELRAHCGSLIARHKIPRYIWFLPEPLPRNANGKFLKRQLRDELQPARAA